MMNLSHRWRNDTKLDHWLCHIESHFLQRPWFDPEFIPKAIVTNDRFSAQAILYQSDSRIENTQNMDHEIR